MSATRLAIFMMFFIYWTVTGNCQERANRSTPNAAEQPEAMAEIDRVNDRVEPALTTAERT